MRKSSVFFFKIWLCGWTLIVPAIGLSAPDDGAYPRLRFQNHEIHVLFSPDKSAVVSYRESALHQLTSPIRLAQASCAEKLPTDDCEIRTWLDYFEFYLVWERHPDPKRVGQPVDTSKNVHGKFKRLLDWPMRFMNPLDQKRHLMSDHLAAAVPTRIQCKKGDWLPASVGVIPQVYFETFNDGLETELRESRVIESFNDVKIKKNGPDVEFQSLGPFHASDDHLLPNSSAPLISEKIGFDFKQDQKNCRVVFDREIILVNFLQSLRENMSDYKPVRFTSLQTGIDQLELELDTLIDSYDGRFAEMKGRWMSDAERVLEAFSLLRVFYKADVNGHRRIELVKETPK